LAATGLHASQQIGMFTGSELAMNCSYIGLLHQEQRVVCFAKDFILFYF